MEFNRTFHNTSNKSRQQSHTMNLLNDLRLGSAPSSAPMLRLLFWPVTFLVALVSYVISCIRQVLQRASSPPAAPAAPAAPTSSTARSTFSGAFAHPKSIPLLDLLAASDDEEVQEDDAIAAAGVDQRPGPHRAARHAGRFEWIGKDDLEWFADRIAPVEGRLLEGGRIGDGWQEMMNKHIPGEVSRWEWVLVESGGGSAAVVLEAEDAGL